MESEISLGTAASRLYNGHWHNNNYLRVVAALDGYLLKLTQPPERQTRLTLQSGKEGTYCLSIFGLMSLESKWIWRSHPMPGSTPDCNGICFPENHAWAFEFSSLEYIVADETFYSLRDPFFDRTIIPDKEKDARQKEF
jgi:hypothetical protein